MRSVTGIPMLPSSEKFIGLYGYHLIKLYNMPGSEKSSVISLFYR